MLREWERAALAWVGRRQKTSDHQQIKKSILSFDDTNICVDTCVCFGVFTVLLLELGVSTSLTRRDEKVIKNSPKSRIDWPGSSVEWVQRTSFIPVTAVIQHNKLNLDLRRINQWFHYQLNYLIPWYSILYAAVTVVFCCFNDSLRDTGLVSKRHKIGVSVITSKLNWISRKLRLPVHPFLIQLYGFSAELYSFENIVL